MISVDGDVLGILEFIQARVPAEKIVSVSQQVNLLATLIWGHHPRVRVVPPVINPGRAECEPKVAIQ